MGQIRRHAGAALQVFSNAMARCFFARSFRALLWRNAIYRRRRWIPSVECCSYETDVHDKVFSHCCFPYPYNQLIEFFLPALCVAVLYFIKLDLLSDPNSSLRAIVVPGYDPGSNDTIIPLSFQDYVTALQAIRICVADPDASFLERLIGTAGYAVSGVNHEDWPVPFVYCSSYECGELDRKLEKEGAALGVNANCTYRTLALAPLNADASEQVERVLKFKTYVEERYPQITNSSALPFKHDFIQIFSDNDELNSYVASENYGAWSQDGQYFPKVAIAVVFDGGADSKTYQYTIRPNSTNFNSEEQSVCLLLLQRFSFRDHRPSMTQSIYTPRRHQLQEQHPTRNGCSINTKERTAARAQALAPQRLEILVNLAQASIFSMEVCTPSMLCALVSAGRTNLRAHCLFQLSQYRDSLMTGFCLIVVQMLLLLRMGPSSYRCLVKSSRRAVFMEL